MSRTNFSRGLRQNKTKRGAGTSAAEERRAPAGLGSFPQQRKFSGFIDRKRWANLQGDSCTFPNVNEAHGPGSPLLLAKRRRSPFNRQPIINGALLMLKSYSCVTLLSVKTLSASRPCSRQTQALYVRDGRVGERHGNM